MLRAISKISVISLITIFLLIHILIFAIGWSSVDAAEVNKNNNLIRLATTTSTDNSGLLNFLLPHFKKQTGYSVHVIAVGTGKALRMGQDGDVDVVLVHAPEAERQFVTKGYGKQRYPVMFNDFVVIGPEHDPANIKNAKTALQAFQNISKYAQLFISRGDNSGTHKKEIFLWGNLNTRAKNFLYREAGQGMGKVLQIANELNAYTLTDRGTWLSYRKKLSLKILFEADPVLYNPYGIIAVNPDRYKDINYPGAKALIDWFISEPAQKLIGSFTVAGQRLFTPSAHSAPMATN